MLIQTAKIRIVTEGNVLIINDGAEKMNLLETYIEEIHSEQERKTDFGYVVDVYITENCYGGITRKKKTFLKSEWLDIKKKGFYWA